MTARRFHSSRRWLWGLQGLVLLTLVALVYWLFGNAAANLSRQGISTGFEFWGRTAGFDIIMHLPPYSEESTYGQAFWVGLCNTLLVSAIGMVIATIMGVLVGLGRLSPHPLVSRLAGAYVELVRNLPLLLHLFVWYFVILRHLPSPRESYRWGDWFYLNIRGLYGPWFAQIEGVGWTLEKPVLSGFDFQGGFVLIPELVALVMALGMYAAAFIAEIIRAGVQAVPRGQWEAARALGLSHLQCMRHVVAPQALRVIIPPLTSQYLNLTKNSSLAAAIAYPDLVQVFAGTVLMQTGQAVEVMALTMGVYLLLSLVISLLMNLYHGRARWVRS